MTDESRLLTDEEIGCSWDSVDALDKHGNNPHWRRDTHFLTAYDKAITKAQDKKTLLKIAEYINSQIK